MPAEQQPHFDRLIAQLATRQHGVVSRPQLMRIGLTRHGIGSRVRNGRLHKIHTGVYAVGHARLTERGRWMAAVLAGGEGAVLSHRSAAALWQIRPATTRAEVTIPRMRRATKAVLFHRSLVLPDEVTTHDGIPVTTVARTVLDLAAVVDRRQVERAMNEAEYRRLWDKVPLAALVARHPHRRGVATARALVTEHHSDITRSELEERFLAFLQSQNLPRPALNAQIELEPGRWIEADCVWRTAKLIVELDSRAAHDTRSRFDSDRERDRALAVAGWQVIRVTWRHLRDHPRRVVEDLRALLQQPARR